MIRCAVLAVIVAAGTATAQSSIAVEGGLGRLSLRDKTVSPTGDHNDQDGDAVELGIRVRYRFVSLGGGLTRAWLFHGGLPTDEFDNSLDAYAVRPRIEILPGRRFDPFVEMQFARLSSVLSARSTFPFRLNAYGRSSIYGGGLIVRVLRHMSIIGSAGAGTWKFNDVRVDGFPLELTDFMSGRQFQGMIGLTVGVP
jgi:hypothetical protein